MKETAERREKILAGLLTAAVLSAVVWSSLRLLVVGKLSWHIRQAEYRKMLLELLLVGGLLFLTFWRPVGGRRRLWPAVVILSCFLWLHKVLVPAVASGLYGCYLWLAGRQLRRLLAGSGRTYAEPFRDILVGSMAVIGFFCLMSALKVGNISCLWAAVLASAAVFGAMWLRQGGLAELRGLWQRACLASKEEYSWKTAAGVTFLLLMFCIQAGRMNLSPDYDSLWYGVRAPFILDPGFGIYENLGLIGVVYTYSKGWETLTLPLSILPSYSFLFFFNLWTAAGILAAGYEIARLFMRKPLAKLFVLFLSSIPSVMNMTITAKTDIATLFVQMIMLRELLKFIDGEKRALAYSLAAFFLSWTFKPTALVFSTAVYGMSLVWLLGERFFREGKEEARRLSKGEWREGVVVLLLGLMNLAGIWARTMKLAGVPVTSVFSSLFTRLGFRMKYPFSVQTIPGTGNGLPLTEWGRRAAKRIYGVLLDPQGADMDHVILAWGSLTAWFALCVWLAWQTQRHGARRKAERRDRWLGTVLAFFAAGNLLSLFMLNQVDGNYFMLCYVLSALYAFRLLERMDMPVSGERTEAGGKLQGSVSLGTAGRRLAVLVMVFSALIASLTNWSWTVGFSRPEWIHRGYYDHHLIQREEMAAKGNGRIWEILEGQPEARMIAIGRHLEVLAFPCCVQSYDDVTGSQGNVVLVKYMDNFVEYLRFAETDYMYIQAGYMSEDMRCYSLTRDLIEYGVLLPVCYDHGNVLAAVDCDGQWSEEAVGRLKEFERQYAGKE